MNKKLQFHLLILCCVFFNSCASIRGNEYCKYPEKDQGKGTIRKAGDVTVWLPNWGPNGTEAVK